MLNVYKYFDEPEALSLYDKLDEKMFKLLTQMNRLDRDPLAKEKLAPAIALIKRSPEYAYSYSKNIIKGRWLDAESIIMKDPFTAYMYAKNIIKGRWEEAESVIMTGEYWWDNYKKHFGIE